MRVKRVKLNAARLHDPEVDFISLVDAGANRSPFKIIKRDGVEERMKGFTGVFASKGGFEPVLAQVWVDKNTKDLDAAKARILAAGLSVEKMEELEEQGVYCFEQVAKEKLPKGEGVHVCAMKIDEEIVGIVVTQKAFVPNFAGTDFAEMVQTRSIFPGLHAAFDALDTTLMNAIYDADSHSDAVKKATEILDSFAGYVKKLVGSMPKTAFKLEHRGPEVVRREEWLLSHCDSRKAAPKPQEPNQSAAPEPKAPSQSAKAAEPKGASLDELKALVADGLKQAVEAATAAVKAELKPVADRLAAVEKAAGEAKRAASTAVSRIPLAQDLQSDPKEPTAKKKDDEPRRLFTDTAFDPEIDAVRKDYRRSFTSVG